jgi:hypothetical protein
VFWVVHTLVDGGGFATGGFEVLLLSPPPLHAAMATQQTEKQRKSTDLNEVGVNIMVFSDVT